MIDAFIPYIVILAAYSLGAIPFGIILTRLSGLQDIRKIGSGNIGATNVLRTGRKDLALMTLILDSAKGSVIILIVTHYFGRDLGILAGLAAFLGHLFPLYLGFKGGKGIATGFGVLLALNPLLALMALATWLIVALVFRLSSLAAFAAMLISLLFSLMVAFFSPEWIAKFTSLSSFDWKFNTILFTMVCISLYKHRSNITRLMRGNENKVHPQS